MQNDVVSVVLTVATNSHLTEPCIDKNWKLEDWNKKKKNVKVRGSILHFCLILTTQLESSQGVISPTLTLVNKSIMISRHLRYSYVIQRNVNFKSYETTVELINC